MKKDEERKEEKSLKKMDPERGIFSLRDAMNKLFDESFWDPFETTSLSNVKVGFPKVDISETEKEVKVTANIPGIDPEKIDIEVEDDYLTLSGKTEKEDEKEDEKFYRYEREYGEFRREFALPAKVKSDEVKAKTKNGVLTITLPKSEENHRKKIKIESE